jgi:hypothetical protein
LPWITQNPPTLVTHHPFSQPLPIARVVRRSPARPRGAIQPSYMGKQYAISRAPLAAASLQIGPHRATVRSVVCRSRTNAIESLAVRHRRSRRARSRVARCTSHIARVVVVDAIRAEGGLGFD